MLKQSAKLLAILVMMIGLAACTTGAPEVTDAPASENAFGLGIDPETNEVTVVAPTPSALEPQSAVSSAPRKLRYGSELALSRLEADFLGGNRLELRLTFKNVSGDLGFARPFTFERSRLSFNVAESDEPEVSAADLGGDGVLSPGEETAPLRFTLAYTSKRPFFYYADAYAVVGEPAALISVSKAYDFQNEMMDAYQQGDTLRLIQSYTYREPIPELTDNYNLGSAAFSYDNALSLIAYLVRGTPEDIERAKLLGDSFLYAQANDPVGDGRVRDGYFVAPFDLGFVGSDSFFVREDGGVNLANGGAFGFLDNSRVGDLAWTAISLTQLYNETGEARYLDGAKTLGDWIIDNAYVETGLGGFTFGLAGGAFQPYKSTEHNIDLVALFTMLETLDGGATDWRFYAKHAADYLDEMWNPKGGYFYTGSSGVGVDAEGNPYDDTIATEFNADDPRAGRRIPEDPQSWSYLALERKKYAESIDWAVNNLETTDTGGSPSFPLPEGLSFTGVTFSDISLLLSDALPFNPAANPNAVWFEGTGHMAIALLERGRRGDVAQAHRFLENIRKAQSELGRDQFIRLNDQGGLETIPVSPGNGIVAASSVLNTGYFFSYFPSLHTGATSWYLMSAQLGNPMQLLSKVER